MTKAIYAFSGDPITYGHVNIIERSAKTFDNVVVGIGINPDKKYMFNLEERTEMAKKALANMPSVNVDSFKGLLVDYAYENNIPVIVKGVRNSADFDYENVLHQIGESQKLGIETHMLFARPELAHISSSTVKAIQREQGLVHEYVPLNVKQNLEARISKQYIIGVSGEIGSGKSYVSQKFERLSKKKDILLHNIELDYIGHKILGDLKQPVYQKTRDKIAKIFGKETQLNDGTINRKTLGEIVFNNPAELQKLNEIMETPLIVRLRRELYGKQGLILLNAALITEANMSYLCNNNVVLVNVDKESQRRRLRERGLTIEQIQRRLASQYTFKQKRGKLTERIKKDNNGKIWIVDSSDNADEKNIENVFDDIIKYLNVKK